MPDEKVIYSTRLHWVIYFESAGFFIIGILLFFLGTLIGDKSINRSMVWPGVIFIGLGILSIFYFHLMRIKSEFAITNKRVIMKKGIISTKTLELLHTKIESIATHQNLDGKIFGYGNISVCGSGGTVNQFKAIEKPFVFRKFAQEEIDRVHGSMRQ
jgi:uncharacterized membrane protein YdbT with pleckstrin-like domain